MNLFRKKCLFELKRFDIGEMNIADPDRIGEWESYATMPSGEQLRIYSYREYEINVTIKLESLSTHISYISGGFVIHFDKDCINYQLIYVPPGYRGHGIGEYVFEMELRMIAEICKLHPGFPPQMEGTLGTDFDFEPRIAKKLYRHFDGYQVNEDFILHLRQQDFKNRSIHYDINWL